METVIRNNSMYTLDTAKEFAISGDSVSMIRTLIIPQGMEFKIEGCQGRVFQRPCGPWSGEGLPPVGAVIEYGSDERGWVPVSVIGKFMNNGELCPICQIGEDGPLCLGDRKYWRPIRTPDQIATEERDAAIKEMEKDADYLDRGAFSKLYAAGWRKQVQQ